MASDHSDEGEYYEVDDLEEMHTAIINDDYEQLHEACEAGADVNEKFAEDIDPQHAGMTPLALASALNRLRLVKMLLDYGAEVNSTFATLETTALMTSSFHGHSEIVRTLLDHGASAKCVDTQGSTALGYAFGGSKSIDVVKMLLSAGVDVNHKNMLGMNALLLVAGYGNDHLVRLIIQSGADPYSTNDFGHTALHLAIVGKRSQVAQLRGDRGSTSLYGLNRRDIDLLLKEWCASHRDMLGPNRPEDSQLEAVGKFMMAIGSKLDEPDELPLDDQEAMKRRISAVQRYREERLQATRDSKKPGVVDKLLSCGGKRGKKAQRSQTDGSTVPSSRPAESRMPVSADVDRDVSKLAERCARIMRQILDAGCPVDNTESTFGMTPLDMAILMGDVESTAQLLAAGADPEHLLKLFALTDLYDVTVVHPDKKKTRELLDDDDKIDVNQPYATFNITKGTNAPKSLGSPGDAQTPISDDGLTPVAAATKGSTSDTPEIIKMLVKHGADIKKIGPAGRSPLGEACRTDNVRNVASVVNSGADIEQQNPYFKNATPVVIAVICKNPKVVEYLIGKGAKLDKPMADGRTSLIKAMEGNDMPMVDTLLGADKNQNFTDKNGFMYEMVELYQREDRDIERILRSISDKVRQFQEEDSKRDREQKPKKDSPPAVVKSQVPHQQPKPVTNAGQAQLRPVPPPETDSEEGSTEEEEESDDEGPASPTHPPPPKPVDVPKKPSTAPKPSKPHPVPHTRPSQQPQPASSEEEEETEEEESEEEESEEEPSPPRPATKPKKPVPAPTSNINRPEAQVSKTEAGKTGSPARHGPVVNAEPAPPPLPATGPPGDSSEEEEESEEESEEEEPSAPTPSQSAVRKTTTTQVVKSGGTSSNTVVTRTVMTKTMTSSSKSGSAVVKSVNHPVASKAQVEELDDTESEEEEEESEEESEEDENENDRRKPAAAARPAPSRRQQIPASAETDI